MCSFQMTHEVRIQNITLSGPPHTILYGKRQLCFGGSPVVTVAFARSTARGCQHKSVLSGDTSRAGARNTARGCQHKSVLSGDTSRARKRRLSLLHRH